MKPEISGGVSSRSPRWMCTTPPASPLTLKGNQRASSFTSSMPRPMNRFTE